MNTTWPKTSINRVQADGVKVSYREALKRDFANASVQFLDTGHFALETHVEEIASAMRQFLAGL
jgi:hypothetical protein